MKLSKILICLFAALSIGCGGKVTVAPDFSSAVVCQMTPAAEFSTASVAAPDGKVPEQYSADIHTVTLNDMRVLRDTLKYFAISPMSEAEGKPVGGFVTYTLDSMGAVSSAIVFSADHSKVYVWPDALASWALPSGKPCNVLVDRLLDLLMAHSVSLDSYMQRPERDDAIKLELLHPGSVYMLRETDLPDSKLRFDLSGLAMHDGKMFCISDKIATSNIYTFDTCSDGTFKIEIARKQPEIKTADIDMEAIDFLGDKMVLADEVNNIIYIENDEGRFDLMDIYFDRFESDLSRWGSSNSGVEGMAIDSVNQVIYFGKEREPRRIITYDLKTKEFAAPYDSIVLPDDGDISDLKYIDGFLFILDRANCLVRKLNLATGESVYASFHRFSNNYKENNYVADFGMAEALLITDDAIFVGFDNNGDPVSSYGESVGLKKGSTKPSVFVFKRPDGF